MGENSSGFTSEHSLLGGAYSGDLLDQKSKSPIFHGGGGAVDKQMHVANCEYMLQ